MAIMNFGDSMSRLVTDDAAGHRVFSVVTDDTGWSYIVGPDGYREGPMRYRHEAQAWADEMNAACVNNGGGDQMPGGFPLQDTGPGMNELFNDLSVEQEREKYQARAREEGKFWCRRCDKEYAARDRDYRCPRCLR